MYLYSSFIFFSLFFYIRHLIIFLAITEDLAILRKELY